MMDHKKMCVVHKVAVILLLVGGLNWGLVGLFSLDLVDLVLGGVPVLARLVYVLIGVSAVLMLLKKKCKKCMGDGGSDAPEAPKAEEPKAEEPKPDQPAEGAGM